MNRLCSGGWVELVIGGVWNGGGFAVLGGVGREAGGGCVVAGSCLCFWGAAGVANRDGAFGG